MIFMFKYRHLLNLWMKCTETMPQKNTEQQVQLYRAGQILMASGSLSSHHSPSIRLILYHITPLLSCCPPIKATDRLTLVDFGNETTGKAQRGFNMPFESTFCAILRHGMCIFETHLGHKLGINRTTNTYSFTPVSSVIFPCSFPMSSFLDFGYCLDFLNKSSNPQVWQEISWTAAPLEILAQQEK